MKKSVKCPHCGKSCEYSSKNPYRPFCSERCKVLDLGAWADETYCIPDPEPVDPEALDREEGKVSREKNELN